MSTRLNHKQEQATWESGLIVSMHMGQQTWLDFIRSLDKLRRLPEHEGGNRRPSRGRENDAGSRVMSWAGIQGFRTACISVGMGRTEELGGESPRDRPRGRTNTEDTYLSSDVEL